MTSHTNSPFRAFHARRTTPLSSLVALALGFGLALAFPRNGAAEILAEDHFLIGEDPMAGEYFAPTSRDGGQEGSPGGGNIGLDFQWAVVPGFTTTEWQGNRGEVNPFGMSYAGLASEGGMAHGNPADHGQRFGRPLDPGLRFTNQTEGTYYLSFLMMLNQDGGQFGFRAMELHDGGFDDVAHRKMLIGVHRAHDNGQPVEGAFGPGNGGWGVQVMGQKVQFEDQSGSQTEAQLFVIRFDMSTAPGGDSVTVWKNPPSASFGDDEPEGGVTLSGFDLTFDRISSATWQTPFWFNPYLGAVFFDEIRLGTSWAAVTPVADPEMFQHGDFLEYNFVGSLEGWEELTVPNANWGPQRWMGTAAMDARRVEGDIPLNPAAAKQFLHKDARFPGGADLAHPTLWMRSPEFKLNGAGDLTFWIMGGGANTEPNAVVPAHESHVPAQSVDTANGGFHGVVLRNADTGDFVMVGNRTTDGTDWEQVTFTAAELAALDQSATYTLDAIDARNNLWAWFNLDEVRIPATLQTAATGIGGVSNQTILVNTSTGPLSFFVYDDEIDPADLIVSASSSNPVLVPNENIVFGGSGEARTVTVTPAENQTGSATITLTVENGTEPASTSFELLVVSEPIPPTIGNIPDQQIFVNSIAGPVSFTVNSQMSDPDTLTLSGSSSDQSLVPDENIVFGGSGRTRTVTVTPLADLTGVATITVTVSDGDVTGGSTNFLVTVVPEPIVYDFDDGTLQGWTGVMEDGQGRMLFAVVPPSDSSPQVSPHQGTHFIGLHIPGFGGDPFYFQDSSHGTLLIRSPEFTLQGEGDLSAWLSGGGSSGVSLAGTSVAALPTTSSDNGFMGIALRDATTGTYVLSATKPSGGNAWQQVGFTANELAALPRDHVYTLDLIDARHGGWGWVSMDTVTIPGSAVLPPTYISPLPDQSIFAGASTGPLTFTLHDAEVDPVLLIVSATSSNTGLVPQENVVIEGEGEQRTVTVTAAGSLVGSTTITLTVNGGTQHAETSFVVEVSRDVSPVVYDFSDGTLQGWTEVMTDAAGDQYFALVPPAVDSPHEDAHSGSHFIGLHIPGFYLDLDVPSEQWYTQDSPHDTLLMRSPEFTLNGGGSLRAWLVGGGAGSPSLAGTDVDDLSAVSTSGGFRGVALRDVTTGTYVLSASKSTNGGQWEEVVFGAGQLAALPQDHVYTLDLIDAGHGGWGWVNMDSVTIPGDLVDEPPPPVDAIPRLAIERWGATEVRLSWPVTAHGWILEGALDLTGDFTEVDLEPVVEGEDNVVYDDIVVPKQFYRLVK